MDYVVTMELNLQREKVRIEDVIEALDSPDRVGELSYWKGRLEGIDFALDVVKQIPWIVLRS